MMCACWLNFLWYAWNDVCVWLDFDMEYHFKFFAMALFSILLHRRPSQSERIATSLVLLFTSWVTWSVSGMSTPGLIGDWTTTTITRIKEKVVEYFSLRDNWVEIKRENVMVGQEYNFNQLTSEEVHLQRNMMIMMLLVMIIIVMMIIIINIIMIIIIMMMMLMMMIIGTMLTW